MGEDSESNWAEGVDKYGLGGERKNSSSRNRSSVVHVANSRPSIGTEATATWWE